MDPHERERLLVYLSLLFVLLFGVVLILTIHACFFQTR